MRTLLAVVLATSTACGADLTSPTPIATTSSALRPGTRVELGDGQTAFVLQALAPVMVRAVDASGAPLALAAVTVSAPVGASARALTPTTDAAGRVLLELRLGLQPGPHAFGVTVGTSSTTVRAVATEPARGTLLTLVNARRTSGDAGHPGPGTEVALRSPAGVALDGDGTVYFSDQATCRVYALSPSGVVTVIAGTGTCAPGPLQPSVAVQSPLGRPTGLAVDRARRRLYIAETRPNYPIDLPIPNYVYALDLTNGMIDVYAGGGPSNGPFNIYFDTWVANCYRIYVNCREWPGQDVTAPTTPRNVPLYLPVDLTVGADGSLYIADANSKITRITPDGTQAWFWSGQGYPVATPPLLSYGGVDEPFSSAASYRGSYASLRFDSAGTPHITGAMTTLPTTAGRNGSLFRGQPGALTQVRNFSNDRATISLAFDASDTLYLALHESHRIVRLLPGDTTELVAGTWSPNGLGPAPLLPIAHPGDGGDYVPAVGAPIHTPGQMVVTDDDHLIFADTGNGVLRMIW